MSCTPFPSPSPWKFSKASVNVSFVFLHLCITFSSSFSEFHIIQILLSSTHPQTLNSFQFHSQVLATVILHALSKTHTLILKKSFSNFLFFHWIILYIFPNSSLLNLPTDSTGAEKEIQLYYLIANDFFNKQTNKQQTTTKQNSTWSVISFLFILGTLKQYFIFLN